MQIEYAMDVVFKDGATLGPLYEEISRQAVLAVKVPDMARFWGKRYSAQAEAQSDFKTLVEGTRIKHVLGRQSLKIYSCPNSCHRKFENPARSAQDLRNKGLTRLPAA